VAAHDSGRLDARASGIAVLAMAILGGSYTAGKIALHDLPVFGMLCLRMLISSATLGAYAAWARVPLLQTGRSAGYVLGQTGFFLLSQVSLFIGLTLTGAGRAAIMFNMQPFFTLLLLPLFVPGERVGARRWLGTAAAFGGVALVLAARGTGGGGKLLGDALCLLAALGWTGNVILNKTMPREINSAALIFWNVSAAIPVVGLLSLVLEGESVWHFTPAAVASLLYLGTVAAGLGFVLIVWLVRSYSASRVNVFVFLSPVFGVLIGWALLGEPIGALQALGAAAVAVGILIVSTER
jgi:drug/metabolite transporter (DMT)-like permease